MPRKEDNITPHQKALNSRGRIISKRRGKEFTSMVKSFGCALCGYNRTPNAIEFHHIGEKQFAISKKIRQTSAIKKELENCIMVCANCHREIHAGLIKVGVQRKAHKKLMQIIGDQLLGLPLFSESEESPKGIDLSEDHAGVMTQRSYRLPQEGTGQNGVVVGFNGKLSHFSEFDSYAQDHTRLNPVDMVGKEVERATVMQQNLSVSQSGGR